MKKSTLVSLVKKEVKKLKQNATQEEISRLNFRRLNPENVFSCIYGQLTEKCYSPRAHELINKCAERMYKQKTDCSEFTSSTLNGKPNLPNEDEERNGRFSPIECFISFQDNQKNGNNQVIIDYLQGNTKKLIFKPFVK